MTDDQKQAVLDFAVSLSVAIVGQTSTSVMYLHVSILWRGVTVLRVIASVCTSDRNEPSPEVQGLTFSGQDTCHRTM